METDLCGLREHKFFRILIRLIETHPFKKDLTSLHSSLVVRGGAILSVGINKPDSNSFALKYAQHNGWQVHSESAAIYGVKNKEKLRGSTLYNCRLTKNGKLEISKPCKGCALMLEEFGIRKVHFSKRDGYGTIKITS